MTAEELSDYIETVEEEGVIDEEQGDLLHSALEFSHTKVADVLTVREDIVAIERSAKKEEILRVIRENKYSRLPVYKGDLDHIVGFLHTRNYLKAVAEKRSLALGPMLSKPFFVELDAEIDDELSRMSKNRTTIAVVRGEEGRTVGLVTVEDFLEELVGEIFDEDDVVNDEFMKLGGNYFAVSTSLLLVDAFRRMKYTPRTRIPARITVAAFVAERLGHTPEEEDTFSWYDLRVTVDEVADGRPKKVTFYVERPELQLPATDAEATEEGGDAE